MPDIRQIRDWTRFARATRQLGGQIVNPTQLPVGLIPGDPYILENSNVSTDLNSGPNVTSSFTGFNNRRASQWVLGQSGLGWQLVVNPNAAGFYMMMCSISGGVQSLPAAGGRVHFVINSTGGGGWANTGNAFFDFGLLGGSGAESAFCWIPAVQSVPAGSVISMTAQCTFSWTNWNSTCWFYRVG